MMPLDDDVNQALSPLHFGMTMPFWDRAVRMQLARVEPRERLAVQVIAASKREQAGSATEEDTRMLVEVRKAVEENLDADRIYWLGLDTQVFVDATFLLLAIRGVLTFSDRVVKQLRPLGKDGDARRARDAFTSQFGIIKELRDAVIHYDEYAIGKGDRRDLIVDPGEGVGITQGDDGYLLFMWAGRRVRLILAAEAILVLSEELTRQFWGPVTAR